MISDKKIKEIFDKAAEQGIADRNETYEAEDLGIVLPTEAERQKALEESMNPVYDIYDIEEDDDEEEN